MGAYKDENNQTWQYRFWWRGSLKKKRGFPTKRAARDAETDARRKLEAAPPQNDAPPGAVAPQFDAAVRAFILDKRRTLAPGTVLKYDHDLGLMVNYWPGKALDSITPNDVKAYLAHSAAVRPGRTRSGDGALARIKGATANRDLAALSALFNWAIKQEWVTANPAASQRIPRQKEPWRPWQTVTWQEVQQIVAPFAKAKQARYKEFAHQILLLYLLGVRAGVVLNMRWEQIDLQNHTFQYRSKGKDMVRVLDPSVESILRALGANSSGFIFASRVWYRKRWIAACRGVGKPTLRPHDLRVTFARNSASAGVDLDTIRTMMGHATLVMTQRYIPFQLQAQIQAGHLRAAHLGLNGGWAPIPDGAGGVHVDPPPAPSRGGVVVPPGG